MAKLSKRTQEILALVQAAPRLPYCEVADKCGASKQWVSYVCLRAGMPARRHTPVCPSCGARKARWSKTCRPCFEAAKQQASLAAHVTLTCLVCGKEFLRRGNWYRPWLKRGGKGPFCSRHCFGSWLGAQHLAHRPKEL